MATTKTTTVVDPTKLTGDAERAYRQANPLSDYTKSVDMRFMNRMADAMQNNTGISQAQMNQYNDLVGKWNVNPIQTNQVNGIYDQQVKAATDAWNAQRDQAVSDINFQKQKVAPQYQGLRNQADVVNLQNAKKLQELMASRGLGSSGENVTATVNQNNARQNALNTLNSQEQGTLNEFDHQIASVSNPAQLQAQLAQINAQRSQAMLDQSNWQKQFDTANSQWNQQFNYGKSQDALQQQNWQKQFNQQNSQFNQQLALQKAQFKSDSDWRKYTYNNMSASEKAQLNWAKQQYGEDAAWRLYELNYNGELQKSTNQAQINAYKSGFNSSGGGGGTGTAAFQNNMEKAVKMGVPKEWVPYLTEIVKRESSFNPNAKNPNSSAYGYGQFLSSTRAQYEKKTGLSYDDPVNQLYMMYQYVKDRYKTPANALQFWNKNKWY